MITGDGEIEVLHGDGSPAVSDEALLQQIEANLTAGIGKVRSSRTFYRRGSQVQVVATASLSAVTTLLIGLNAIYPHRVLVAVSLATAGLATVATAWTSWFGFHQLWVNNTIALTSLYALRSKIEYDRAQSGLVETATVLAYRDELEGIFSELNSEWIKVRERST